MVFSGDKKHCGDKDYCTRDYYSEISCECRCPRCGSWNDKLYQAAAAKRTPVEAKRTPVELTIPPEAWTPVGTSDRGALEQPWRLVATVTINGTLYHFDAFQVFTDADGQRLVDESGDGEMYEKWCDAAEPDGPFETVEITLKDGVERSYVIFASPYC